MLKSYRPFLAACLCLCLMWSLNGQDISYTGLNSMQVCQSDEFNILIRNTTASPLNNPRLQIQLPCFVEYVSGSVQNASEDNISNLNQPSFDLSDLEPGEDLTVQLTLFTPCNTIECIDNADIFNNLITLQYDGGSTNRSTDNYNITNALPLIVDINAPIINASKGAVVSRFITIQNTRPGKLNSFIFSDNYGSGLSIDADLGTVISSTNGIFELEIGATEFQQIGNGDTFFDFNEEIVIEEILTIDACGYETSFVRSDLDVEWGCQGDKCEDIFDPQVALIQLDFQVERGPILEFTPEVNNPDCFCDQPATPQSLQIRNFSSVHNAENITVFINTIDYDGSALGNSTINLSTAQGVVNLFPIYSAGITTECRDIDTTNTTGFYIQIPEILANETVTLNWETFFCRFDPCTALPYKWIAEYDYTKACTVEDDILHQGTLDAFSEEPYFILTDLSAITPFSVGQIDTVELSVNTLIPSSKTGTLDITVEIPCQLKVLEEDWLLGSQAPSSIQQGFGPDGTTVISLSYDLPLLEQGAIIPFVVEFTCAENCGSNICSVVYNTTCSAPCDAEIFLFQISTSAALNFTECNGSCLIEYCDFRIYTYECELEECIIDVPGYYDADFSLYRLNTGLPDNDDDHFPDPSGNLMLDSLRLDRLVTGDTLRAEVKGKVQIDIPGSTFDRGFIEFKSRYLGGTGYDPKIEFLEYEKLTSRNFGMPVVQMLLSIYDESEDTWYYCDNVPILDEDSLGLTRFNLNLDVLRLDGCSIPLDFTYASNDSIIFQLDYKVNYNTISLLLNYGRMEVEFKNVNALYEGFVPDVDIFTCDCTRQTVDIANYKSVITESLGRVDWCEGMSEPIELNIKYGTFTDYTPYEYKPSVELSSFTVPELEGVRLKSVQIISLFSNGQRVLVDPGDTSTYIDVLIPNPTAASITFPGSASITGFHHLDLLEGLGLSWDDNIELRLRLFYENEGCIFEGNPNYYGTNENLYSEPIQSTRIPRDSNHKMGLLGKFLRMDLIPSNCDVTSLSDTITWDLEFQYNAVYPFDLSEKEIDLFLEVLSSDGDLIPIEVIDLRNNTSYDYIDGGLNLGRAVESDTFNLLVKAVSLSCEKEDIIFRYGWICEGDDVPCQEKQLECTGIAPPGIIDILVDTARNEYALCDTFEWRDVFVFNAGLGKLRDIELLATLPPGLEIVEGSSQIIYPSENGQLYSISDPSIVAKNRYRWSISDTILPFVQTGLPGVNSAPQNSFEVIFKVVSKCEFVSGSRLIFTTEGELICDVASNAVSRISGPQTISELDTSAQVNINASSSFDFCNDQLKLNYELVSDSLFGLQDKLIIQIPPGVNYLDNTCMTNEMSCIITEDDGLISIELTPGEDTIDIDLVFAIADSLGCERIIIPAYTTASLNAFCATESLECSVDYVTGESIQQIDLDKPSFEINKIDVSKLGANGDNQITVNYTNTGEAAADSVVMSVYLDLDLSGDISAADSLVQIISIQESILPNTSETFTFIESTLDISELCYLMIAIEEQYNCICLEDVLTHDFPITVEDFSTNLVCSGDSVLIGPMPAAGQSYSWFPSEHLSCVDCAQTIFSYTNASFESTQFIYYLEVSDAQACAIRYEYIINVEPELSAFTPSSTICSGDSIELIGPEASSYEWKLDDQLISNERSFTVAPEVTSEYNLTVTDGFGCTFMDTVVITVIERPIADAGSDILACFGQEVILNATNATDSLTYLWSPGFPFLEDPSSPMTNVLDNEDRDYVLTVANGQCTDTDTVSVSFFDGLELPDLNDLEICLGESVLVELDPAFEYTWNPTLLNFCLNDSCSEVSFAPQSNINFIIQAQDEEGCLDTINLNIIVNDTLAADTTIAFICPGDSVFWEGNWYDEVGTYCIELDQDSLCQNQTCLQVFYYAEEPLEIIASDTILVAGDFVDLSVNGPFVEFNWTATDQLDCLDCPNPSLEIIQDQWVYLQAVDENGCLAEDSIFLRVITECIQEDFKIPNAFTPNQNNANDVFRVVGIQSDDVAVSIEIYSRWGELLFEGFDNSGWDGEHEGDLAPEGVYLYIIRIQCPGEESILYKGDVTLIR